VRCRRGLLQPDASPDGAQPGYVYKVKCNESGGSSKFDTMTGSWKQHELKLFDSAAPRVLRAPGTLAGYIMKN
jgi:hypothetical protein